MEKLCVLEFAAKLLVTPLVHWLNYCFLLGHSFLTLYKPIREPRSVNIFVLPSNMFWLFTEIYWSLDEVIFCNHTGECYTVVLNNSPIIIIYQFTLTAGKMATVKARQRKFFTFFVVRPRTTNFCQKN